MEDDNLHWSQYIRFRNPSILAAVITQTILILAGMLVIFGLLYVVSIVIVITIHHFLFDRNPTKVPDYVKKSSQFSSSEDEGSDEEIEIDEHLDLSRDVSTPGVKRIPSTSTTSTTTVRGPTNTKVKKGNLDKFLADAIDRPRKMKKQAEPTY